MQFVERRNGDNSLTTKTHIITITTIIISQCNQVLVLANHKSNTSVHKNIFLYKRDIISLVLINGRGKDYPSSSSTYNGYLKTTTNNNQKHHHSNNKPQPKADPHLSCSRGTSCSARCPDPLGPSSFPAGSWLHTWGWAWCPFGTVC